MKLLSLHLKNFRQHRDTSLEFPSGLVGIVGHNGSGKTSIVESVAFALFGSKATRGKVSEIVTRGLDQNAKVEVSLLFERDGVAYRVERTISDAQLYLGGEPQPISRGNRDVTNRVAALLGMSFDEFVATYFTEQKGLEFLSGKKGTAERERFVVRMMGYDRLEKIQELLRLDRRDIRNQVIGGEASVGLREELEKRIENEKKVLKKIKKEYQEAETVLTKGEAELEIIKKDYEEQEVLKRSFVKLKADRDKNEARSGEIDRQLNRAGNELAGLLDEKWNGTPLKDLIKVGKAELPLDKLATRREKLDEKIAKLKAKNNKLLTTWREQSAIAKNEKDLAKSQHQTFQARLKKQEEMGAESNCPTCGQELGESFKEVLKEMKKVLRASTKKIKELDQKLKESKVKPEVLSQIEAEIEELEGDRKKLLVEERGFKGVYSKIETIKRLGKEKEHFEKELKALEAEKKPIAKKISELSFTENTYNSIKGKFDASSRLVEVARLSRVKLEGKLNTQVALVDRSEEELINYDKKVDELKKQKSKLLILDEGDKVLTEFRKHLNATIRPRLAELASEFLAELTDGRYTTVEISEDFTPTVLEDGEIKAVISGGEEDILNLCVRLALSQLLAERAGQSISFLVLDEVFGSLDEQRRNNVLELLEKLSQRFEQILVITHLEDIKDAVRHLFYVDYDDTTGELQLGTRETPEAIAFNL